MSAEVNETSTSSSGQSSPVPTSPEVSTSSLSNKIASSDFYNVSSNQQGESSFHPNQIVRMLWGVPVVSDFITVVVSVNIWLSKLLPVYSTIICFLWSVFQYVNRQFENVGLFNWIVGIVERTLVTLMDKIRSRLPTIYLPPSSLLDTIWNGLRDMAMLLLGNLVSYRWVQRGLRTLESILDEAECYVLPLATEQCNTIEGNWYNIPRAILLWYKKAVVKAMKFGRENIHSIGESLDQLRRDGALIIVEMAKINSRRKASPRRAAQTKHDWTLRSNVLWLANKILVKFGLSQVKAQLEVIGSCQEQSTPSQDISSAGKKRKLSDEEGESSCDLNREPPHYCLFRNLDDYNSEEDPSYEPSDHTTDSYEYRSSNDEGVEGGKPSASSSPIIPGSTNIQSNYKEANKSATSEPEGLEKSTPREPKTTDRSLIKRTRLAADKGASGDGKDKPTEDNKGTEKSAEYEGKVTEKRTAEDVKYSSKKAKPSPQEKKKK